MFAEKQKRRKVTETMNQPILMKVKRQFPYDVYALMEAVRNRPAIWDKNSDDHKDKVKRRIAWDTICFILEPEYENLPDEEKKKILSLVSLKWTYIRDAFVRSVTKLRRSQKGHYVYYDHLTFLIEPYLSMQGDFSKDANVEPADLDDTFPDPLTKTSPPSSPSSEPWFSSKRLRPKLSTRYKEEDSSSIAGEVDEDMAFFQSLLTPVRSLSMAEKMEFRIGVLTMLQHFGSGSDEQLAEAVQEI